MNSRHPDTDRHSNDLTQLSSREQLSALMDGALPADQTRFLLRRLQHDESLAASWERWRIAGEAMRGLAPTQRLPADFARRVGAALHGEQQKTPVALPSGPRSGGWRWGGGAALAASVALVAVLALRPADAPDVGAPAPQVAAAAAVTTAPQARVARPEGAPVQPVLVADAPEARVVAPVPRERAVQPRAMREPPAAVIAQVRTPAATVLSPPAIVTRPWPRAVLPQYAHDGLAVGFGDGGRASPVDNPFQQAGLAMVPAFEPVAGEPDAASTVTPGVTDAAVEDADAPPIDPR